NALLGALIAEARPVAAEGDDLILAFAASAQFLKKKAEDPSNRMTVGEALHAITGVRWRLSYELREAPAGASGPAAEQTSEEGWVRRFIDEFDAEELPAWEGDGDEGAEAAGGAQASEARAMTGNERSA